MILEESVDLPWEEVELLVDFTKSKRALESREEFLSSGGFFLLFEECKE